MFYASNGPFFYREVGFFFNGRLSARTNKCFKNFSIVVIKACNYLVILFIKLIKSIIMCLGGVEKIPDFTSGDTSPNFPHKIGQEGERTMPQSIKLMNMAAYVVETQNVL